MVGQKKVSDKQYENAMKIYKAAQEEAAKLIQKRDIALIPLNDKVAQETAKHSPKIDEQKKLIAENEVIILAYAKENAAVLFSETKKVDTGFCIINTRAGVDKVVIDFEDDKTKMAELIGKIEKAFPDFVSSTTVLDKAAIIKGAKDLKTKNKIEKLGIKIEAEDTYKVAPLSK